MNTINPPFHKHRSNKHPVNRFRWAAGARLIALLLATAWGTAIGPASLHAQSAMDLLAGFDAQRLQGIVPGPQDSLRQAPDAGELAKLLYRLGRLDPDSLQARVTDSQRPGDAVAVRGTVREMRAIAVPEPLVEMLEIGEIHDLILDRPDDSPIRVLAGELPGALSPGDHLQGFGVQISGGGSDSPTAAEDSPSTAEEANGGTPIVAATGLDWIPAQAPDAGWRLLSAAGVDVGMLPEIAARDRQPLTAEDSDGFYALLAAAKQIGHGEGPEGQPLPRPTPVAPIELLQNPASHVGHWVRMPVETVRVTRVSLSEQPERQRQLGQDHYFQIDAIGDLGNVQVQIPASQPGAEPIQFQNRYPVTLVTPRLPKFLAAEVQRKSGPGAVVAPVSYPLTVDGFFFRLWSYESDFMSQRGGEQFGPLLVAARLKSRQLSEADPVGVAKIGWWAAAGILIAIALIILWAVITSRTDARIRQQRRNRQAQQTDEPST